MSKMSAVGRLSIFGLAAVATLLWGALLLLGTVLVVDQYRQGTGSIFLVCIGIVPYAIAVAVSAIVPFRLLRSGSQVIALTVPIGMILLWLFVAFYWFLAIGGS